jgi:hypothetical protein
MKKVIAFAAVAAVGLAFVLPTQGALAQEKQRVSFKVSAANTKYTQQHAIDVGDVPDIKFACSRSIAPMETTRR